MNTTTKIIVAFAAGVTVGISICALLDKKGVLPYNCDMDHTKIESVMIAQDTVIIYHPIAKTEHIIRHDTVRFPIIGEATPDSATVDLPINQQIYEDSTFRAWVSGYDVALDSIEVYPTREIITLRPRCKEKHWHLGPQMSVGVTPGGLQPMVGIGITFSFFSF